MHARHVIIVLTIAFVGQLPLCSQVVELEGRKFMLNEQEFYPMVMNYGIEFMSNTVHPDQVTDSDDILVSPAGHMDKSIGSYFEYDNQNDLDDQFEAHFQKILDMGFNTIRLLGAVPFMRREGIGGPRHYSMHVRHNLQVWTTDPTQYNLELDPPYFSNDVTQRLFTLTEHVLDLAESKGLKVILLCAEDEGGNDNQQVQLTLATDLEAVDWYSAYLHELAEALEGHPALMAYDIWNEPLWTNPSLLGSLTKAQVCEYTTQWYDALKSADPQHLVTLGGSMYNELNSWDPAVMKLDFYSPHEYPYQSIVFNYDVITANEAYQAQMYWLGADCPMPWLIGETGFVAEDDVLDPMDVHNGYTYQHLDGDAAHHRMPFMNGSELEQDAFAQLSLEAVRNYRGSGYSWWDFQNSRGTWFLVVNEYPNNPEKWMQGNFFGLLKYGNDVVLNETLYPEWLQLNSWRDKIAVGTFTDYDPGIAPEELPPPPTNYGSWFSTGGVVYRQYTIIDQEDEPVANALAEVNWLYTTANPMDHPLAGEGIWDRNPADAMGICTLRKRGPTNGLYNSPMPRYLRINASGAESIQYDAGSSSWPLNGSTVLIGRRRLYMDAVLTDHLIPLDAEELHMARSSLTLTTVVVAGDNNSGGVADFKARDVVHVLDGFHAQRGSEVHLFTQPIFLQCGDVVSGMAQEVTGAQQKIEAKARTLPKRLELSFDKPSLQMSIYPNPCSTQLRIVLAEGTGQCTVVSSVGAVVFTGGITGSLNLDVSQWATGEYVVKVYNDDGEQATTITKL